MDSIVENKQSVEFRVDNEHGALRFSIILVFIVGWIISFLIFNALIPSEGLNILAGALSFGFTALLTQQMDKLLKQRWPSGRAVRVADDSIALVKNGKVEDQVDTTQVINVLTWRFAISRRSHVRKGWFMVACALEQDDHYIPLYTFISPQDFEKVGGANQFTMLQTKKELNDQRNDMRLAGIQRRLHSAENVRWMSGAEMNSDDFLAYLARLQEQFPQWMPSIV